MVGPEGRLSPSYSIQFSSVQSLSRVRLCGPMNRSTPGLPVHHQLPEFIQTHAHRVSDAIQPSHPLSSPSPSSLNPSQHQGLLKWVSSLHQVAKVLELQLQHQSFQWIPKNPTPGHIPRQNCNSKRYMHPHVHSSTIYNSQDMETSVHQQING